MQVEVSGGIHKNLIPVLVEKANYESGLDEINVFSMYAFATQIKYKQYIVGVSPSDNTVFKQQASIDTRVTDALNDGLQAFDTSIENFAQVKYYLDKLFYDITEQGILNYTYQNSYLISSARLGKIMNISRATIHRYKELGLESITGIGHNSYPKHNELYWKDGVWASKIQALYQSFKIRNQSKEELIKEIKRELDSYEKQYGGTFEKVFKNVKDPYELDEPDDFFNWRDLLEDLKSLNE